VSLPIWDFGSVVGWFLWLYRPAAPLELLHGLRYSVGQGGFQVGLLVWPSAPSELLHGSKYAVGGGVKNECCFLFWFVCVEEMMASSVAACFCGRLCLDSDFLG